MKFTVMYAGSNPARQAVGKPGHCDECVQVGHIRAHPELGCADVGCNEPHRDQLTGTVTGPLGEPEQAFEEQS